MWVAYCREDLPTKAVVGWSSTETGARRICCGGHDDLNTGDPAPPNDWEADTGNFELNQSEWDAVYVPGNGTQTSANIVSNHGDKFV